MRKLPFYVCTAAAILAAGTMTGTAYGATAGTYNIPGGRAVVIGGSGLDDLKSVMGQLRGNTGCGNDWFSGTGNNACGNDWFSGTGNNACGNNQTFGNGNCQGDWNTVLDWWCGNSGCDNWGGGQNKPCTPDKPDIPDKPDTPDKPDIPDKPGTPDKPDIPDKPGTPDKPDVPNKPGKPDLPEQPGNDSSQDAFAAQVVDLVNVERSKAGLSTLKLHTGAEAAAMVRAREIERSFSHTRPNGSSFYTALQEAGITYQSAGENIAYGQTSAQEVMNVWMNSSGHRANILSGNYTSIAVAHYRSAAGVDYWVQLFLR